MNLQETLSKRTFKQHCLGSRVAVAVNILWGISNYFMISENKWTYVGINFGAAAFIVLAMLNKRRFHFNGESLALVPMLATLTAFAYTYNTIDIDTFGHMTYTHMAVFIGAGMFLLWDIKYSILSAIYAVLINALFFSLSPLSLEEYFSNGAVAVLTVIIFMVISIQTRYKLVISNIKSTLALEESKEELKSSEEQHRLLFEQNPTAMLICSVESMKIIAVNDAVVNKYGYTREEFESMSITDLHREIDIKDVLLCAKGAREGYDMVSEWIHVLKDKSEINVELVAKTLMYENKQARLVSIKDMTAIRENEHELIKARRIAEQSKEMQSQFLSNMSHEIRTPMNGIMGITRILQETEMDNEQRHYLNAIMKSSKNLMVIINDILDFSKIEAGKIVLEETRFNLREIMDISQEILTVNAEEKGIYLHMNIDEDIPDWLEGDTVRLSQIMMNLISNGIKFTENGGVSVHVTNEGEKGDKSRIRFAVRDTGIGIPQDKVGRIFESFTQASSSTTRKHGGTGLGLTISKQLAEIQDGDIWVESEEGKGSIFYLEIPYKVSDEQTVLQDMSKEIEEQSNAKMLTQLKGTKILLVEDHPINQMLAIKVLEDWGLDVDLAENGKIALDKVSETDYAMILMDISMPEMDGYTATQEIRTGKYTDNIDIPIVAMTASALIGEKQKCYKAGMNDYITKPFEPQVLLEKIYNGVLTNNLQRA